MAAEQDSALLPGAARMETDYETRRSIDQRIANMAKRALKRQAQTTLRWALGQIGRATRDWDGPPQPLRAGDPHIRRILVVRVDLLGDVVLSTPAVRVLRRAYPRAQIDMLVQAPYAGILEGDPDIHRVHVWNPHVWRRPNAWLRASTWVETLTALGRLRMPRYDLAISVSGDIGSIVTRLTGARRRVGYSREAYQWFMTDPVEGGRYQERAHETSYVLRLAAAAGAAPRPEDAQPRLAVAPQAATRMRDTLAAARSTRGLPKGPVIAMHAGAHNGQAKRWPARHWATLARRLVTDLGALVVLTGAPNEDPLAREVERMAGVPLLNLCGKTSLPELKALLSLVDLVISGDSGPMHIACAVGAPVIALHGPTDPLISGPTAPDALVLRREVWCSPCYDASATAECRFGNPVCMKELAPSVVFAAARKRLATRSPSGSLFSLPPEPASHGAP
ncbi:MAG TPA: lipopolysaccharide heptosyltransferase II [Ktedonobacterales bacterium]